MSRQTRIVVAVLILFALLYSGTLLLPGQDDPDAARDPGGLVGWLGDRLGRTPDAERAELESACFDIDDRLLVRAAGCTLRVAASEAGQRNVRLYPKDTVTIAAPAPGRDTVVTTDAAAGDEIAVAVSGDGADITLTCPGEQCLVTLRAED